jgi:REP element-mobilizing transposase RayT
MSDAKRGVGKVQARRKTVDDQPMLPFRPGRGGKRKGAGRKSKDGLNRVTHMSRPALKRTHPVHVTARLRDDTFSIRQHPEMAVLRGCFEKGGDRFGFRLVHYSVQSNHIHMICEAEDETALTRGMQGLLIRIAKGLNRLWGCKGKVFADRYHAVQLKTPKQVRNALAYVLNNHRHHGIDIVSGHLDPFSSGEWFLGWREPAARAQARSPDDPTALEQGGRIPPVLAPECWLLRQGWSRHHAPISIKEVPGR